MCDLAGAGRAARMNQAPSAPGGYVGVGDELRQRQGSDTGAPTGPLAGIRVLEIAAAGPGPFCAMVLSDLGAEVLRLERPGAQLGPDFAMLRGRRSAVVDLKHPDGAETVLCLAERADVLIEGFRPGVVERLGVGPEACLDRNPRLIYARMTGWGQSGPLARGPGHDINYLALSGALHAIGRQGQPPTPPLTLAADYGGGGMLLSVGILSALVERASSGRGQVIDAAMVDGAALLTTIFHGLTAIGRWLPERGANELDSGAPYYDVYETADGQFVALGALEPQFYAELLRRLAIDPESLPDQESRDGWPAIRARFAEVIRERTRDEWGDVFEGAEACFAPVLSLAEAPHHPHNRERGTFVEVDGMLLPAPAPRFSRTPGAVRRGPATPGADTAAALAEWGIPAAEIDRLRTAGAVSQAESTPSAVRN